MVRSARKIPPIPSVPDRLAQAVAPRDLVVERRGGVATDLDHVDRVVGAVEGAAAIVMGLDRGRPGGLARRDLRYRFRGREPFLVDVMERERGRAQLRVREEVTDQHPREFDAPRADERDLGRVGHDVPPIGDPLYPLGHAGSSDQSSVSWRRA